MALRHTAAGSFAQTQLAFSIDDVNVTEGTNPTAVFTVTLNFPGGFRDFNTTVDYATSNGTAAAPGDYTQSSGTLTFRAGPSPATMTISIPIVDDTMFEGTETFTVTLSNPTTTAPFPASISRGSGICAIFDNDPAPPNSPTLSISDVTVTEGNAGTTNAVFIVSISAQPSSTVTVDFATADGTATVADNDYNSASGTLTFTPQSLPTRAVIIQVVGDTRAEANENFFVNLVNPSGANIADGQGAGAILDDESCAFAVEPTSQVLDAGVFNGASGSFTVIAPPGCAWEARSEDSWIDIRIGRSDLGTMVTYNVLPNTSPTNGSTNRRTGEIRIFPRGVSTPRAVFTVIQEGLNCTYRVSPLETVVEADGGIASFSVSAPEGCGWVARSRSDFINIFSISPAGNPSGNGSVSISVSSNRGSFRSGVASVAQEDVTIYQNTPDCPEEFVCRVLPIACGFPVSNMLGTSRQFRDQVLSKSERGQRYTRLYYDFSSEIVQQMIFHPSLVLRSMEIKERYLPVIEAMVKGKDVTLTEGDLEEIDGFLNAIAARGSRELQETIKGVRADLRDPRIHAEFRVKVTAGPNRESNAPPAPVRTQSSNDQAVWVRGAFGKLPMRFELNQGQTDSQVKFIARGPGYGLFLTPAEATLRLRNLDRGSRIEDRGSSQPASIIDHRSSILDPRSSVLRMKLAGAHPDPRIRGVDKLPGKTNYFTGQDQSRWRAQVPSFARVKYENVYKGVDLVYYGNQGQLEYDFIVAPGADPSEIRLAFEGAEKMEIDANGDLALRTPAGLLRQRKPQVYQEVNGTRLEIPSRYRILDPRSSILD